MFHGEQRGLQTKLASAVVIPSRNALPVRCAKEAFRNTPSAWPTAI